MKTKNYIIALNVILLLIISHSTLKAQFFTNTIVAQFNEQETDYGHFSIEQLANEEGEYIGYLLAGTKYLDNSSYSSSSVIEVIETDNQGIPTNTTELSAASGSQYTNWKCFRMNKRGQDGNYLIMGSAEQYGTGLKYSLLIELDKTTLAVTKHMVFDHDNENGIALDAQFIPEFTGDVEQFEGGYFMAGMVFEETVGNELKTSTEKSSYYALVDNSMNNLIYSKQIEGEYDVNVNEDYIHRVEYIPNIGIVVGGSRTVNRFFGGPPYSIKARMLLALVEPTNGSLIWEWKYEVTSLTGATTSNREIIGDFVYDAANDALHVGCNADEGNHNFGLISINNFSSALRSNGLYRNYSPGLPASHGNSAWVNKMMLHPDNGNGEEYTDHFVVQFTLSYDNQLCGAAQIENVVSALGEFEYDDSGAPNTSFVDFGYRYKKTDNYGWNYAYNDYFNGMYGNSTPRSYANSLCLSNESEYEEPYFVINHYRNYNGDTRALEIYRGSIASSFTSGGTLDANEINCTITDGYEVQYIDDDKVVSLPYNTDLANKAYELNHAIIVSNTYEPYNEISCDGPSTFCVVPQHYELREKSFADEVVITEMNVYYSNNFIHVEGFEGIATVKLLDVLGKIVLEKQSVGNQSIEVGELPSGIYFVRSFNSNGEESSRKIFID